LNLPKERAHNLALLLILAVFVLTAVLYAVRTPLWQNPDEPAHFNYIRYVWDEGRLPVLQMGDYPHEYLEQIKSRQFPPDMPIDPIRYEFHQPPLYYLAAAPVYGLAERWPLETQALALRFLSVGFGAAFLWVCFRLFRLVFPADGMLALLATGLAATVPMYVALSAAVNNDGLSNLLLVGTVLLILRAVRAEPEGLSVSARRWIWAGVVLGLAMLTKSSTYVAIPLGLLVIVGHGWRKSTCRARVIRSLALFGPALLLNLPWYIRNVLTYGGVDILGLQRHNSIVLGQPTTAEWVARMGWGGVVQELAVTTFRSFWAQFGWMGVLVGTRLYQALALACALMFVGFLLYLLRAAANRHLLTPFQWKALGVLGFWLLLTGAAYLWYNAQFVQHQGRYFFPALPVIALAMALGFQESLRPTRARLIALLCVLGISASLALVLITGRAFKTLSLLLGLSALAYVVVWRLRLRRAWVWQAGIYWVLVGLDLICLFQYIVPYFTG
jgi:hypothetical protein